MTTLQWSARKVNASAAGVGSSLSTASLVVLYSRVATCKTGSSPEQQF